MAMKACQRGFMAENSLSRSEGQALSLQAFGRVLSKAVTSAASIMF